MIALRPQILRQFLEATFHSGADAAAVEGATFDEWYELCRMQYPLVTKRTAALNAPTDELRAYADRFPDERTPSRLRRATSIERRKSVDLREVELPRDVQSLQLSRLKRVSGWQGLGRWRELERLGVVLCSNPDGPSPNARLDLDELNIIECDEATVTLVLASVSAVQLSITYDGVVFDLARLVDQTRLRWLHVGAMLVRELDALGQLPLTFLGLGRVEPDAETRRGLEKLSGSIENLSLSGTRPFGPELLPDMPALRRLSVPAYDEFREAWIDFAVANYPKIGFSVFAPPSGERGTVAVEEIYRGIDVLRVTSAGKAKKSKLEVSGDMTDAVMARDPSWKGDNGDLEDELRVKARRAKKKLSWGSEADTLVAWAADVETCRWLIDQILGPE